MNKLKLIQVITKDLEELRTLTDEIAENQDYSTLIADLALSRARLLCQEIELLREYSVQSEDSQTEEDEDEIFTDEEEEISGQAISEPELEILHFDEPEFPDEDESLEEEEDQIVYDSEEEETDGEDQNKEEFEEEESEPGENPEEEDLTNEAEEDQESEEDADQEIDADELEETPEENFVFEDEVEEQEEMEEEPGEVPIQLRETKAVPHPEVREMSIEELGDEEDEPMQFSPISDSGSRSGMHEIPKPEEPVQEEQPVAETFQKERSLNDVIGEKKEEETIVGSVPITSLRSAIGLNDRFLFIREIFNNNTDKFNTIIEQLDKLETIQQAVDYLRVNLTLEKNETSLRFVDLLKRRFTK